MSSDEEYYIILHVGGHFVKDPYVRYVGREVIRLKENPDTISYYELCIIVKIGLGFNTVMLIYFHELGIVGLQNNIRVIYDDTSTIAMLDFWVKFKEIDLYVEHEVDNPIIINENFLLTTGEGDVEGVEVDREGDDEGVEPDGEGDLKKVESGREGDIGEVQADGEGVSTSIEVDEDIGMESGGHISLGSIVGKDNDSEVAADEYASDFATSNGVDNIANEYASDFATLDGVDKITDEYAGDFATSDGLDNVVATCSGEEEDRNETEVWYSYESGSLVRSDKDEEHKDGERKRSKFPLYNDKLKFSLGILFKDGK
ncbi:Histone-lysine N-methyltransferase SETDB1 [Gossypium arboreum]|uniref:Histone-lysine N-methyltransferase SETDB1 n=1 Tax=Gossypium arboreum TaxID=29729 RepID=A0A0B0NR11_GOSAR|nr:Histone-lysine N-methyltransferase SETDB1 [Gossypium arboreum]